MRAIVARRLLDSPDDVEDALQEGLVRIWREFATFPEDPDRRVAYAGQIVNRASIDLVRRKWGRNLQRRRGEVMVDFTAIERSSSVEPEPVVTELQRIFRRMSDLDDPDTDSDELHRRLVALKTMLPALKPIELDVLLAHHPAGANRKSTEVALHLGITHGQARQHYMEAMAILRPLLAHVLAPSLPADEAERVLDYTAGVMTDKRQRGRMKRHLQHCTACRALAKGQEAVIGVAARLLLPLPLMADLTNSGATTSMAMASGGGAAIGGGLLGGVVTKLAVGGAALTAAVSGLSDSGAQRIPHPHAHRTRTAPAAATPRPGPAAAAPTAPAPSPTVRATAAQASPRTHPDAAPTVTPAPTASPATAEFAITSDLETPAAPNASAASAHSATTPPKEFGP